MQEIDDSFMHRALEMAQAAKACGSSGIACVIVLDGKIIGEGCNEVVERHDPTAHAEMVAIRRAGPALAQPDLKNATLYTTLQPCGMCTMASIWSNIGRIVYGAGRDQVHRMYFEDRNLDTMDFIRDAYKNDLLIEGGVLGKECSALYHKPDDKVPDDEQGNI